MSVNRILKFENSIKKSVLKHRTPHFQLPKLPQSLAKDKFQKTAIQSSHFPQKSYQKDVFQGGYGSSKYYPKKMLKELRAIKFDNEESCFDEDFLMRISKNYECLKIIYKLAKMTDNFGKPKFGVVDLSSINRLSDKQIKRIPLLFKIINPKEEEKDFVYGVYKICKLPDKKFKKAIKLIKMMKQFTNLKFYNSEIVNLVNLDNKQLKRIAYLNELETKICPGRHYFNLHKLCQIPDEQFKNVPKLLEIKYPNGKYVFYDGKVIQTLVQLPQKRLSRIPQLIKIKYKSGEQRFDDSDIVNLLKLSDKSFANIKTRELFSESFKECIGEDIAKLAKIDNKSFKNFQILLKNITNVDDLIYMDKTIQFAQKDYSNSDIQTVAQLLKKGFKISDTEDILNGKNGWKDTLTTDIKNLVLANKISVETAVNIVNTMATPNRKVSKEILADIKTLKQGKSIIPEFNADTPLEYAFKESKVGDAVQIGEKMFINDGISLIPWKMTREKFNELFPPVERFATQQGAIEDCFLVSVLDACMKKPLARTELYKSFQLDGNDIICTIRAYKDYGGKVRFENGECAKGVGLKGCKGLQLIEQAYAKTALRKEKGLPAYMNTKFTSEELMARLNKGGYGNDATHEILGLKKLDTVVYEHLQRELTANRRCSYWLDYRKKDLKLKKELLNLMLDFRSNEPYSIVNAGTINSRRILNSIYDMYPNHIYFVDGYNWKTSIVTIINPFNTCATIDIPIKEFAKYFDRLDIARIR